MFHLLSDVYACVSKRYLRVKTSGFIARDAYMTVWTLIHSPLPFFNNNAEIDYRNVKVLMDDNVVKSEINKLFIIM